MDTIVSGVSTPSLPHYLTTGTANAGEEMLTFVSLSTRRARIPSGPHFYCNRMVLGEYHMYRSVV